jgi:hypothetical protein
MAGANITAQEVRSVLDYDPSTGIFRWKIDRGNVRSGSVTGCLHSSGYLLIGYRNRILRAHRIAWLYVHGEWPSKHIDHINGIKTDNRIVNLRDVSRSVNGQNQRQPTARNKLGLYLGVYKAKNKYSAQIAINGKSRSLGQFTNADEAYDAYLTAKRKFHEGNTL